ncbi:MAG: prepilin peptidase [Alphaproteobacteria bacterium]|nr:prepilin peptidase [Alphaproteobacteria bacterium]
MSIVGALGFFVLTSLLGIAAAYDLRERIIPNWLSAVIAGAGLVYALVAFGPAGMLQAGLAGLGLLALGFGLFGLGLWGGGDGKLIGAVAVWFAWPAMLAVLFWIALWGGVMAAVMLLGRRGFTAETAPRWMVASGFLDDNPSIPYGVAISLGALTALVQGAFLV